MIVLLSLLFKKDIYLVGGLFLDRFLGIRMPIKSTSILRKLNRLKSLKTSYRWQDYKATACIFAVEMVIVALIFKGPIKLYLIGLASFVYFLPDLKLNEINKQLELEVLKHMPMVMMSLMLLLKAGMPTRRALDQLNFKDIFSLKLKEINEMVKSGQSLSKAFSNFQSTCQMHDVTRFCRILIQDEKNGSHETVKLLDKLRDDLYQQKRNAYLKRGEELSTKLLFPMMIALFGVLIAITFPAIMALVSSF